MADSIMETIATTRNMDLVSMFGLMEDPILDNGMKESKMMKESTFCQTEALERGYGKTIQEKNGKNSQKKRRSNT